MNIVALCGGVGGSKLALGLNRIAESLMVIVNTGDDFRHYGLLICPDIDTVLYTLSDRANAEQGWGRANESFAVRNELAALGEEQWFTLGDKDIALHLLRAHLLAEGQSLSHATDIIRRRMGIRAEIAPMVDRPAPTRIVTDNGTLDFQDYFVRQRCVPVARAVEYGVCDTPAAPEALNAIGRADAIIFCPSNPLLSIAPILSVKDIRNALANRKSPALAVSPIVNGTAVKGPTAKMFSELGIAVTGAGVARQYRGLIDIFVLDESDAGSVREIESLGMHAVIAPTLMHSTDDKIRLAEACLAALDSFTRSF